MMMASAALTPTAVVPSLRAQSNGATQEIRLRATVPTICALKSRPRGGHLTGHTDDGHAVHISGSGRDVHVECNTPYHMSLHRVTTHYAPDAGRHAAASQDTGQDTGIARDASAARIDAEESAYAIEVSLASRSILTGSASLTQRCTFAMGMAEGDCALSDAAGGDLPPPRGLARFAIVAPADDEATRAGLVGSMFDAAEVDEMARAGAVSLSGKMRGAQPPDVVMSAREIITGSLRERPGEIVGEAERRAGGRQPKGLPKVLNESLRLSVSGRF